MKELAQQIYKLYKLLFSIYSKIYDIGAKQIELINSNGELAEVIAMLQEKEKLVDKTNQINKEFAALKHEWQENGQNAPEAYKTQINDLVGNVSKILEKILVQDKQIEEYFLSSGASVKSKLQNIQKGKRVQKAYQKYNSKNKFTDKKR